MAALCEPPTYAKAISGLCNPYAQLISSRYRLKAGSSARRLYDAANLCLCSWEDKMAYL
jgi:hypothetical protein